MRKSLTTIGSAIAATVILAVFILIAWKRRQTGDMYSIYHAVQRGDQQRVAKIVKSGYDVNAKFPIGFNKTRHQQTLLHEACKTHNPGMVKLLLGLGANPSEVDGKGKSPAYWLLKNYDSGNTKQGSEIKTCVELLVSSGLDLNQDASRDFVYAVVRYGELEILHYMLESGVSMDLPMTNVRWRPLVALLESERNSVKMLDLMLKYGLDIEFTFNGKKIVDHFAESESPTLKECSKRLLEALQDAPGE